MKYGYVHYELEESYCTCLMISYYSSFDRAMRTDFRKEGIGRP